MDFGQDRAGQPLGIQRLFASLLTLEPLTPEKLALTNWRCSSYPSENSLPACAQQNWGIWVGAKQ